MSLNFVCSADQPLDAFLFASWSGREMPETDGGTVPPVMYHDVVLNLTVGLGVVPVGTRFAHAVIDYANRRVTLVGPVPGAADAAPSAAAYTVPLSINVESLGVVAIKKKADVPQYDFGRSTSAAAAHPSDDEDDYADESDGDMDETPLGEASMQVPGMRINGGVAGRCPESDSDDDDLDYVEGSFAACQQQAQSASSGNGAPPTVLVVDSDDESSELSSSSGEETDDSSSDDDDSDDGVDENAILAQLSALDDSRADSGECGDEQHSDAGGGEAPDVPLNKKMRTA